jgi:hypothetical protein
MSNFKLDDSASSAMLAWFIVIFLFSLFVWIGLGVVTDKLTVFQFEFSQANTNIPVSQDRVNITTWMIQGYWAWLVFGIIIPIMFYAIVVAKRRMDAGV